MQDKWRFTIGLFYIPSTMSAKRIDLESYRKGQYRSIDEAEFGSLEAIRDHINQEQNEVESEQEVEPGREPEPEPEPEPDPNELWMCPATGVTMPLHKRADYLSMSPEFKECWQRVLASLVEKRGKRDVEKRVARRILIRRTLRTRKREAH